MKILNLVTEYNEMEISALKLMAHFRSDHKIGDQNTKYYQKSIKAHYYGLAGEFAVAKALNGFFDPMPKPEGDLHFGDVIADLDGSIKISVKTTGHTPGIFKIKNIEELDKVSHIALCEYNEPKLKISWIHEKEYFLGSHFVRNFKYGERFCCY